ncbi:MAG: hypothetical protein HY329_04985 [Chloroflexi bacterium]|nr:hypothetical protein [Chloroflexota bacterium]
MSQRTDETSGSTGDQSSDNPWREVGHEVREFGNRLAGVLRANLRPEHQQSLDAVREAVRAMAAEVENVFTATKATVTSPEVREQGRRVFDATLTAQSSLTQDIRERLSTALRDINQELGKYIDPDRGDAGEAKSEASSAPDDGMPAGVEGAAGAPTGRSEPPGSEIKTSLGERDDLTG